MGFKKWLKGATRIRFDDRTLGNLTKNVATGAGAVLGGPVGLAIAGGGSALGSALSPGSNIGDVLKSGVRGAGTAAALHAGAGMLKNAVTPGGAPPAPVGPPRDVLGTPADFSSSVRAPTPAPSGILNRVGRGAGNVLEFAKDNPTATGMALQGVGALAGSDSENRLRNAQAARLERETGESEYDFQRRKEREAQYADLWSPLGTAIGSGLTSGVARNPYAVG